MRVRDGAFIHAFSMTDVSSLYTTHEARSLIYARYGQIRSSFEYGRIVFLRSWGHQHELDPNGTVCFSSSQGPDSRVPKSLERAAQGMHRWNLANDVPLALKSMPGEPDKYRVVVFKTMRKNNYWEAFEWMANFEIEIAFARDGSAYYGDATLLRPSQRRFFSFLENWIEFKVKVETSPTLYGNKRLDGELPLPISFDVRNVTDLFLKAWFGAEPRKFSELEISLPAIPGSEKVLMPKDGNPLNLHLSNWEEVVPDLEKLGAMAKLFHKREEPRRSF
jgi:hypothetical protein